MIKNGQFFDLGLPTTDYHRTKIIKQAIQELYDKFTLVLIYEYIDESLVLMKRRLCWQFDDILYLDFQHANKNTWNRKDTPDKLKEKIRRWNQADTQLYDFFNRSLWTEIEYEGEEFWKELREFKKLKENTEKDCLGNSPIRREEFFLNEDDYVSHQIHTPTKRNTRMFLNTFRSSRYTTPTPQGGGSGSGPSHLFDKEEKPNGRNNSDLQQHKRFSGSLLTDVARESQPEDGSGEFLIESISTTERMLNSEASSWNTYFCKKLILSELEYLDYFRKKHAYSKLMAKH